MFKHLTPDDMIETYYLLLLGAPGAGKSKFIDFFIDALVELRLSDNGIYDIATVHLEIDDKIIHLKLFEPKECSLEKFAPHFM